MAARGSAGRPTRAADPSGRVVDEADDLDARARASARSCSASTWPSSFVPTTIARRLRCPCAVAPSDTAEDEATCRDQDDRERPRRTSTRLARDLEVVEETDDDDRQRPTVQALPTRLYSWNPAKRGCGL